MHRPSAHRVASRFIQAASEKRVTGSARGQWINQVWDMYEETYSRIGMHIPNPQALLKYKVWDLTFGSDGEPVAFSLYKTTPFGLKSGLSGHDGSSAGKSAAVANLRSKYKQPGIFGEVSHKVKSIALAAGSPVICSAYADDVTGKDAEMVDPISYSRTLKGVGRVVKTLIGRPKGVPTTDEEGASCPLTNVALGDVARVAGRPASLLGWGDGLSEDEEAMYDICSHCSDEALAELM